ncbi:MAG: PAS domain-containing hybrid sensor histidine kinase/response regulator [Caulobacterales bacterium]|nr:PAS domain-containing hybrid sensor histidine kinase/response regulator [Caulobacterales bacterium]
MAGWLVIIACALYGAALFAAAWLAGRERFEAPVTRHYATLYALALAVYCTSWTFFGAVGTAAVDGWTYLPIYLGPILVFVFAPGFLRRVMRICKDQNITTLADFLSARYGRSGLLAMAATALAAAGALPYIALQLKSVTLSFAALTTGAFAGVDDTHPLSVSGVAVTALVLAAFAVAFGARTSDTAGGNRGMVLALAIEAVVKLAALVAVAVLALAQLFSGERIDPAAASGGAPAMFAFGPPSLEFVSLTILAMAAIVCLPRQFHVTFAEAPDRDPERALARARVLFPAYLVVTSAVVIPIALAGAQLPRADVSPDLYVLAIPAIAGADALALAAFIGGVSAATGMIIVAAVALSTMITQDLILPALLRLGWADPRRNPVGRELLAIRRGVIIALMACAAGYLFIAGDSALLAQIGLIAFVAAAQLAPALVGGVYWPTGHRKGALAGVAIGGAIWFYTLAAPAVFGEAMLAHPFFQAFGGALHPHGLLGVQGMDPVTHAAVMSLTVNIAAYVVMSLRARPQLIDRVQSLAFTRVDGEEADAESADAPSRQESGVTIGELQTLAERVLAPGAVRAAFARFAEELGEPLPAHAPADWRVVHRTELLLAGALGSSTARIVLGSALSNADVPFADVLSVLDETNDERRFKRHLLQATLENISQGVSVIDRELRLVAWNGRFIELFSFPPGLVHVGRPVEDVARYMAERGELGPGDVETQVARRLAFYRAGGPHQFERVQRDGRVLRIEGNPMPGGGYVTTFTDVTVERQAEKTLRDAKELLERRVEERTRDLLRTAEERDRARKAAERSEATKTRFLAAASHDLQQPLNAARLFAAALSETLADPASPERDLAANIDRSIRSADAMLRGLLDLSRFEADGFDPAIAPLPLQALFDELAHSHRPVAAKAGLALRVRPTDICVRADKDLLRSILQNLLSNALRYTEEGGVLLAARARHDGESTLVEVWDTGPGVPEEARARIFQEFRRLHDVDCAGERGAGLGLAIAARAAHLMDADITLRSRPGRGSVFSVRLSASPPAGHAAAAAPVRAPSRGAPLARKRVLCLDDEPSVLNAMSALLERWGCAPVCVSRAEDARRRNAEEGPFDVALFDYHLGGAETGVEVLSSLGANGAAPGRAAILTADQSDHVLKAALDQGLEVFAKPVDPNALRAFLR